MRKSVVIYNHNEETHPRKTGRTPPKNGWLHRRPTRKDGTEMTRKQAEAEAKKIYKGLDTEWTEAEFVDDYVNALIADGYLSE